MWGISVNNDDEGKTPRELLREYPPVGDAIDALATLLQVNPRLRDDILVFAIALGICAAEERMQRDYDRFQALHLPPSNVFHPRYYGVDVKAVRDFLK
jgi:hypothetical protein